MTSLVNKSPEAMDGVTPGISSLNILASPVFIFRSDCPSIKTSSPLAENSDISSEQS